MKLTRNGRKKIENRNLMLRGRTFYYKTMVEGRVKMVSLNTDDLELAKTKRNLLEQKAAANELEEIKGPRAQGQPATLQQVFDEWQKIGGVTHKTLNAVPSMMMRVVRVGLGKESLAADQVRLTELTRKLVRDYQDAVRNTYEKDAGTQEKARRLARDLADRTSKSTFNQAKTLFCRRRQLVERYREAGLTIPGTVADFCEAGAVGKMTSKVYFPPSDAILAETFQRIEELGESGAPELEEAYAMFWAALATGCRRNEIADMKCSDLVELDGRLWVGAGLGKDGQPIRIPVINWPVHPANARTPESVIRTRMEARKKENGAEATLIRGHMTDRYDNTADTLNAWMARLGWRDEKKLHGLRAYIGSKLYARNPRLAQLYLRHKSIATTEKFYSHFLALNGAFEFDQAAPAQTTPALAVLPKPAAA